MYEKFMQLLRENNITSYKVSKDTGVTQTTLSDWKNGRATPKTATLQKIADYFNVSVNWLTGKSKYKNETDIKDFNWGCIGDFECAFDFAPLLSDCREEQGVSIQDMAKCINATPEQYIEIEAGILPINKDQAETLCRMLGTNTSQVLFDNQLYEEEVPEEYHNDVRKWEMIKEYEELDAAISAMYPGWIKGKNYLPSPNYYPEVEDVKMIEKYHALDDHGQKIVTLVLDEEYNRVTTKNKL